MISLTSRESHREEQIVIDGTCDLPELELRSIGTGSQYTSNGNMSQRPV